jgi:hypothetical protein
MSDRQRRYRERRKAGLVRLTVLVDRLWAADMLHQVGELVDADNDERSSLEPALQRLTDWLIEQAKEEKAYLVTRNSLS